MAYVSLASWLSLSFRCPRNRVNSSSQFPVPGSQCLVAGARRLVAYDTQTKCKIQNSKCRIEGALYFAFCTCVPPCALRPGNWDLGTGHRPPRCDPPHVRCKDPEQELRPTQ